MPILWHIFHHLQNFQCIALEMVSPYNDHFIDILHENEYLATNYKKKIKQVDCSIFMFRDQKLFYSRQKSDLSEDLFSIKSLITKGQSDSQIIRHKLKEFPDQLIDIYSKSSFHIEIEVPMNGMRAFHHLGIATMAAKSYVPLSEFVQDLEGIQRGSDAYTTTEVESYN